MANNDGSGISDLVPDIVQQLKASLLPELQSYIKNQVNQGQQQQPDNLSAQSITDPVTNPSGQPDEGTVTFPLQ